MGLDIVAFERAELLPEHEHTDTCYDQDHVYAFVYDGFEHSLRGLVPNRCYAVWGETHGFRAGSYSGYNEFRDLLAQAALGFPPATLWNNPAEFVDAPFFELINFADNEGTIGPEAAADLALDFDKQRDKVLAFLGEDAWYQEKYDDWTKAFNLAADTGIVMFT